MKRQGVCYEVGRVMMWTNWRPDFDPQVVHRELQIIKHDLHCNAVRICGEDIDRLTTAALDALQQGFEVWLSPEVWDKSPEETLNYIGRAAAKAEELRKEWPDQLVFSVGSELTLFMKGILKGETFLERLGNPVNLSLTLLKLKVFGTHNKPLNAFLARANTVVREVFHGPVTYAAAPIEAVDWSRFDFVGLDYYRGKRNRGSYGERLKRHFAHGKPVMITEIGCCTYQGAEEKGGRGFLIVDRKNPERLNGHYVRDESLQAHEIIDMLGILDETGVEGAFVFTFIAPGLTYNNDPLYDLDMPIYSLVKSYANQRHGTTYPDMPWEPKESFQAVAKYYRNTRPEHENKVHCGGSQ